MSIDARLESLEQRHRDLDMRITEEQRRPMRDEIRVHDLKRRKLAIKDEIFAIAGDRETQ